jgi:hypothetical protein
MTVDRSSLFRAAAAVLLAGICRVAGADVADVADVVALYRTHVDAQLTVPADEARRYAQLADDARPAAIPGRGRPRSLGAGDLAALACGAG